MLCLPASEKDSATGWVGENSVGPNDDTGSAAESLDLMYDDCEIHSSGARTFRALVRYIQTRTAAV